MNLPVILPLDNYPQRIVATEEIGLAIGDGQIARRHVLLIELLSPAEVIAITDWIGAQKPPQAYGGPI